VLNTPGRIQVLTSIATHNVNFMGVVPVNLVDWNMTRHLAQDLVFVYEDE